VNSKSPEEEEALRLARELRRQVSDLRDQAKAVGQAIASQPPAPDRASERSASDADVNGEDADDPSA